MFQAANQLCTSCFASGNCCNQTNRLPCLGPGGRVSTISRPLANWGGGRLVGEIRPPMTSDKSSFTQTTRNSPLLPKPTIQTGHTHRPALAPPLWPKRPLIPPPPKTPNQQPFGAVIEVSNRTRPTEGQGIDQEISANHDSDVTLAAISGADYKNKIIWS